MTLRDDELQRLLQAALSPVDPAAQTRDVWFELRDRLDSRPRWSLVDTALAAGILIALLLVPEALFVLALHL